MLISNDTVQGRPLSVRKTFNVHLYIAFLMTGIKFVPTSERRVSFRTEECAERTWERDSGAPLVPVQRHAALCKVYYFSIDL